MSAFLLLAAIPPLLWAAVNHLDKYSVERYMQGRDPGALVIFSGVTGALFGVVIFILGLVQPIPSGFILPILFSGALLTLSYVPYMYALERDEASNAAPLFQLITPYAYILALVFLNEHLSSHELLAGGMIFVGAVLLSFDFKKTKIRLRTFLLMSLASIMVAGNSVLFKSFALRTSFWTTAFYDMAGMALGGLVLFCVARYRRDFFGAIRRYKMSVTSLSVGIESVSVVAGLLYGFITLSVPIAIVQFVMGLQPLFILLIGIMLTKWAPRFGIETVDKNALIQKFSAILLMVTGLILLSVYT